MSEMVELTDKEINAIRFWADWDGRSDITPDYRPHLSSLIRNIEAKLPKRLDPRNLPPGPELDELTCSRMSGGPRHIHVQCASWSRDPVRVGQMFDWLHEQRVWVTLTRRVASVDGKTTTLKFRRIDGQEPYSEVSGDTPQHALARAVAIVGGQL